MSSQNIYLLSNFYLNLAKYLNEDFHSYDTLLAENFYKINEYTKAKKIYEKLRIETHWSGTQVNKFQEF